MTGTTPPRRRDAARSRELLLRAAGELFSERGFERTTTRDIGERAGVDPALIARYFGGKTQLYVAALQAERGDTVTADLLDINRLLDVFERADRRGIVPLVRVAVQPLSDPAAQDAALAALHKRLVDPLCEHFARLGLGRSQMRAEIVVAAVIGVLLGRHSGAFGELTQADPTELVSMLHHTLAGDGETPPPPTDQSRTS
ncbi:TetR/AcrR family transcriptional regulator [Streptomyces sp. NTH33]|uniref:TetR/AcrR family transcriptional regulator n=1 Tax=Streptomyces sp. NTH33 TaxID=1735453 RepID=UPI000DA9625C|nr:TetR/AcrR family transcriptional regulator [Streptomyces sp. NTH33]PZG99983.1 TetR/AcrR family transcriptional regulator [Streptomyces sp. NTH33]